MMKLSLLSMALASLAKGSVKSPNIVFVLMDDLGWHDVSYNGGQFPTPNIDGLWSEAVELNRHYIHLMCSPSRTQFLTGRYAMRQGIGKMLPWDYTEIGGIPIGQPTVADWLQSAGYTTYAVGKWHCGYAYEGLLPTNKGFDHFYGFYQGAIHYGTMQYIDIKFGESNHYDFWEDEDEVLIKTEEEEQLNTMHLYRDKLVEYIEKEAAKKQLAETEDDYQPFYMYVPLQTIHGPLDRVHEYEDACDKILGGNIPRRSKYCQNMLLTDDVLGDVINSLKENELWDDTLFILTSDNGADIGNKGCNFPLRGTKGTLFDGNVRTIALVGGGIIPTPQRGTYRDALVSSLDWTPTLLHYAHALNKISKADRTWDGEDQHELIMKGEGANNENVKRDHIVFNIGLRSLESASIVFEKDNHLYKYIAQDPSIDQWLYKREDGWCVPEKNGDWAMIMDEELSMAQNVDNKYLFDLSYDLSERTNLLQLTDQDHENQELIDYAKGIMTEYTQHSLYSEHLPFLWNRLPSGDPSLFGEGSFVAPFLTETEYFRHLSKGFGKMEDRFEDAALEAAEQGLEFDEVLPFSKKLKGMYFKHWEAPTYMEEGAQSANTWYIYTIIGIVIVALIVIFIVSVARWRHLKSVYKDGYEAIKEAKSKGLVTNMSQKHMEEAKKLLKDSNDSDCDEQDTKPNAAEYTHIDSNKSNADIRTALISVEN